MWIGIILMPIRIRMRIGIKMDILCQLSIHNTEFNSALFYINAQLTASELEVLSIKDLAHRQVIVRFLKVSTFKIYGTPRPQKRGF
jgi:hypothetical protein